MMRKEKGISGTAFLKGQNLQVHSGEKKEPSLTREDIHGLREIGEKIRKTGWGRLVDSSIARLRSLDSIRNFNWESW